MLDPEPLPKSFVDRAKALGVVAIEIQFSGGSDQGYCTVFLRTKTETTSRYTRNDQGELELHNILTSEIEDWAFDAYCYSGAGDGNDYGDDITYDLERNVVEVSEWYTQRVDGASQELDLVIEGVQSDEESQKNQEAGNN